MKWRWPLTNSTQSLRVTALLVILLLACGLILWHTINQHITARANKFTMAKTNLDGAAEEITNHLRQLQSSLEFLTNNYRDEISNLALHPFDKVTRDYVYDEIKAHYPNLYTMMITDNNGLPLLDDYDKEIDHLCRADIIYYAQNNIRAPLQIHPNPQGYHYDFMTRVRIDQNEYVIFFLGLYADNIAQLLKSNSIPGYRIVLVHTEHPALVEVTTKGSRDYNTRTMRLDEDEMTNIHYRVKIPDTYWEIVAIESDSDLSPVWTSALWAFSLLLLLGSTALWFLRRTDSLIMVQSNVLNRKQRRLNHLQQTTISSAMSFHEKVRSLLIMGLDEFVMQVGILSRVEDNQYHIVTAVSPDNTLQPGMIFPLNDTYCRATLASGKPKGIENTAQRLQSAHPYFGKHRIGSYLGTTVYVHGKVFGTLNFSSSHPYDGNFTEEDYRFLQLMAQWIGLELERRESEQQLQTKNQLLESISRAQSYFIADNIQPTAMFDQILSDLLSLSHSNVGFIAEVLHNQKAKPYLNVRAIRQRHDSNDELMAFIEEVIRSTELYDNNNVFGEVIRSGAPVISNDLKDDKRLQRLTKHQSAIMSNFIGVPLYHGTQLVGMFGLANCPDGYHESFLYTLAPLATATANLIWALRNEQQRIHTERALRESEEQLKLALEGANDGLWDWNIATGTIYYSPRWQTMLGYEPGEIRPIIKAKEDIIHPDDKAEAVKRLSDHLKNLTPIYQSEHRVRTKDGSWIWVLDRGKVVERDAANKPLRAVGTHTDVSERKFAEEAVRERETRIAAILDTAVDGIITINEEGLIETFNPAAEKIFGYRAEDVLGRNVSILMTSPDRDLHDTFIRRYINSGQPKILGQRREVIGQKLNGTTFPMQLAISEMYLGGRRHFTGIIRDITQTKAAEELLRDTMALKQGILDSTMLSIISTDADGIVQTFNAAAQQMLGYREREVVGKATPELFHDRDEIIQRAIMLQEELGQTIPPGFEVFVAKARIGIADEQKWTYVRKDGTRFPVQLTMTALHDGNEQIIGYVAMARDISRQQQAEEEISRFKTTLDMTLDCVFMFSPDSLRYFYVNQGALEHVGYSYGELLRMTPADLSIDYDDDNFRDLLQPMISGQRNTITFETTHRHRNGGLIPVEIFLQYIYPVDQEPRFVAIVRDITERRRTAESLASAEERSRLLLESAGDGIYGLDLDGRTTFVNPAAANMLGYEAIELIGQSMHEIIQHSYDDGALYNYTDSPIYAAISEGDIQRVSNEVMFRKDGSSFPVEYTVTPIRKNDEIAGAVVTFNDITQRKKVEHIKNEFISTVSHELRTPLTSVRGSLGLLAGGAGGDLPEQAKTLVNIANKNTERLLLLINDILDIEKIESGKMAYHYKLLELNTFLEAAVQANYAYGEQFGVSFVVAECPDTVSIYADEDRLMQVMNNLLSNAAKFSPHGAQVDISAVKRGNKIRISVTDSGKGIPQSFHKHIFEKFAQADASDTRTLGGTGLGLSISKAIIQQHGGRIDFLSRVNMGTTFYFDLPIWTREDTSKSPKLVAPAKHRMLICEHDADIAYMLRMILAQAGFDADTARTVEQAKQFIKENQYLAVTLDIALPDEYGRPYDPEGITLIKELRRQDRTRELPVIVVSATADQARMRLNGSAFGIIDWLDKPMDEQRLLSAIRLIAEHKQGLPRILHVEDDPIIYEMVRVLLRGHVELVLAPSIYDAHKKLRQDVFDLILLDIELTDGSGLDLIRDLDEVEYMPQVVIFSAHEVGNDIAQKVKAALVKSKDSRKELINVIMSVIKERDANLDEPVQQQMH